MTSLSPSPERRGNIELKIKGRPRGAKRSEGFPFGHLCEPLASPVTGSALKAKPFTLATG